MLKFVIDHPEEYLTSVEGWYSSEGLIHGLKFTSNKKTSDNIGYDFHGDGTQFNLQVQDKKIIGFYGSSDGYLKSIGAYFVPIPPKILEAEWDDGSHAKVKRVQLTYDDDLIYSIQVTYDRTALQSQLRGSVGPKSSEFTLDSDEYITALSGYRKTLSSQITALTFTTNKKTYGPYGKESRFQFSAPGVTGKQIAGFLGSSSNVLNSIDVHYARVPAEKLDPRGGTRETEWYDGSDHDGLTKIYVRSDASGIQLVKFDYVKAGQPKLGTLHGVHDNSRGSTREFAINHPEEYLVSVEGWCGSSTVIMGIQFKTNLKTYEYMGYDFHGNDNKFALEVPNKKIIGFHGFANNRLTSIGAYFVPLASTSTPTPAPAKKLEAKGGATGAVWDDGHYDDVKKVYVGQGQDGIGAVKSEYVTGSKVTTLEHGKSTLLGYEEFALQSDEYITSVEGTYDKIFGTDSDVVTMLIFKTNKNRTSDPFGLEGSTKFVFKEEGYKIAGFHGRAGETTIHAIGVYVAPVSTTPLTPAQPAN